MTTAYAPPLIQDADDGPGLLTDRNDGQVLAWDARARRFVPATLPPAGAQQMRVMASGANRIQDAPDGPGALAAGDDGKALVWNQASGRFVVTTIVTTPGGSTTQVQYNNAGAFGGDDGMTYDAAANALTITGYVVTPAIRPAADSTTAFRVQKADGTPVVTVDTTNGRVGIGLTPTVPFEILTAATGIHMQISDGTRTAQFLTGSYFGLGTITSTDWRFFVDNVSTRGVIIKSSTGYFGAGTTAPGGAGHFKESTTQTTAIRNILVIEHASSNTPAAGFGAAIRAVLESSTTEIQDAGRLTWSWIDATHATRAAKGQLSANYITTERPAITWGANSTVALLSFYDVTTPIARQVLATGAGATVDNVITALQNLGLVKQS